VQAGDRLERLLGETLAFHHGFERWFALLFAEEELDGGVGLQSFCDLLLQRGESGWEAPTEPGARSADQRTQQLCRKRLHDERAAHFRRSHRGVLEVSAVDDGHHQASSTRDVKHFHVASV
jgi:hypothetical protein